MKQVVTWQCVPQIRGAEKSPHGIKTMKGDSKKKANKAPRLADTDKFNFKASDLHMLLLQLFQWPFYKHYFLAVAQQCSQNFQVPYVPLSAIPRPASSFLQKLLRGTRAVVSLTATSMAVQPAWQYTNLPKLHPSSFKWPAILQFCRFQQDALHKQQHAMVMHLHRNLLHSHI